MLCATQADRECGSAGVAGPAAEAPDGCPLLHPPGVPTGLPFTAPLTCRSGSLAGANSFLTIFFRRLLGYGQLVETVEADRLRHALMDALKAGGSVRSACVEAALRAVPRHLFIPGTPLNVAYANEVVLTKRADDSTPISSASQPSIVARMLEQLKVEPGNRVLEIGAGTGYNAALLSHLAGPGGQVTTIDVDEDITRGARATLQEADYPQVRVVLGDGALGCPDYAPYDRVIATVGAWDLPIAWLGQLAPAGRLVVPLRLRGSITRAIAFERDITAADLPRWRSVSSEMCSFMPLRGGVSRRPGSLGPARLRRQRHRGGPPRAGCRRSSAVRRHQPPGGAGVDGHHAARSPPNGCICGWPARCAMRCPG